MRTILLLVVSFPLLGQMFPFPGPGLPNSTPPLTPATTGRTAWFNMSTNANIWQTFNPFATHPTNGQPANTVDNIDTVASNNVMLYQASGGDVPTWASTGLNGLGAIQFNGTSDFVQTYTRTASALVPMSTLFTTSAFTIFIGFESTAAGTAIGGNVANNVTLWTEAGYGGQGISLTHDGSTDNVNAYVYSSGYNTATVPFSLNAAHYVMMRLDGSGVHVSIDGGSETTIASGSATFHSDDGFYIARDQVSGTNYLTGYVGEIIIYNQALSGTDLTNTLAYMASKW